MTPRAKHIEHEATPPRITGRQKLLLGAAVALELAWLAALAVLACL